MMKQMTMVVAGLALAGCASTPATRASEAASEMPDWVLAPKPRCGVGSTKVRSNIDLAREAAEAKARASLARKFEVRVKASLKQYAKEGQTAENAEFSQELIESASKEIVDFKLTSTATERLEAKGGQLWAEVCIGDEALKAALSGALRSAPQKAIARLQADAEKAWDKLDEDIEKNAQ